MLLNQIWKRQLTLVTYGNAYLSQDLSFARWLEHPIFQQQQLEFRDLINQQLLAQHFQIWLEALKKQGVKKLSLHHAQLLNDEKNPNANVELLPYAHFMVSHSEQHKQAWICGKELAAWYSAEQDFVAPAGQSSSTDQHIFWRFELNKNLIQRIQADFQPARWEEIRDYLNQEIFQQAILQDCVSPAELHLPYTGLAQNNEHTLALIPTDHAADFVHQTLHRFDASRDFIQHKIQHPYDHKGEVLNPDAQQNLRAFLHKLDELHIKFIVKTANHYQTAQLRPLPENSPLDSHIVPSTTSTTTSFSAPVSKTHTASALKLIIFIVVLCSLAYYFGL